MSFAQVFKPLERGSGDGRYQGHTGDTAAVFSQSSQVQAGSSVTYVAHPCLCQHGPYTVLRVVYIALIA
jgi:hypothetical protein